MNQQDLFLPPKCSYTEENLGIEASKQFCPFPADATAVTTPLLSFPELEDVTYNMCA